MLELENSSKIEKDKHFGSENIYLHRIYQSAQRVCALMSRLDIHDTTAHQHIGSLFLARSLSPLSHTLYILFKQLMITGKLIFQSSFLRIIRDIIGCVYIKFR